MSHSVNDYLFTALELLGLGFIPTFEGGYGYFIREFSDGSAMVTGDVEEHRFEELDNTDSFSVYRLDDPHHRPIHRDFVLMNIENGNC